MLDILKSTTRFLCSRVFADKEAMITGAVEMAGEIAGRSPVAVQGTKINLLYSRDHSVAEGLDYMVTSPRPLRNWRSGQRPPASLTGAVLFPSGHVEHEHASDRGSDQISSGLHGEEKPQDRDFLQTLNLRRSCCRGLSAKQRAHNNKIKKLTGRRKRRDVQRWRLEPVRWWISSQRSASMFV